MAAHCLCSGQQPVGLAGGHHEQVAVALKQDGFILYDAATQAAVKTWALGADQRCAGSPAYDAAAQRYFAAVHPATDGASASSTLLTWPRKAPGGSLKQAARAAQLPAAVHSLHAIPPPPGGSASAMEVDSSGGDDDQPAVFAVYASGAVAVCSPAGVLSESHEARGLEPLAACAAPGGGLAVVHADARSGGASCSSYTLQGGKVQCGPLIQLAAPEPGSRALAAAALTSGRTAVLWSNGALAVYATPLAAGSSTSSSSPLQPQLCRRLRGFALPGAEQQQQQAAATPSNGKLSGSRSSRKRAHGSGSGAGARGALSLAALGGDLLAVVGWSTVAPGGNAVRVVVLDSLYGCVQVTLDLTANDVGAAALDPSQPVLAVPVGRGGQLAVAAGGCVLLAELQLRQPTLANLIGALCFDSAAAGAGSGAAVGGDAAAAAAAAEGRGPANPCAAAAAAALHETELAALMGPASAGSAAPVSVQFSLQLVGGETEDEGQPASGSGRPRRQRQQQRLLEPAQVSWREPAADALQQAERGAWAALLELPAGGGGKKKGRPAALLAAARQLVQAAQRQGVPMAQRLLARLLQAAAERREWECFEELLAAQHPGSLAACPGLVPALAEAGQYPLLQLLLSQAADIPADEVAAALKCLLRKPASDEAKQAQRAYRAAAAAAAEAAVSAAEQAAGAEGAEALLAVAACTAAAVEGFTSAQVCLHPLAAARHDGGMLLGALRQLSAGEALALLRYLRTLLHNYAALVGDRWRGLVGVPGGLPAATVLPHPAAAVEWAGAALDANMARLVLQPQATGALADMRSLVEQQLQSLRRLSQAKGTLDHLTRGAGSGRGANLPAPHAAAAAQYTLEWLDLRVA